MLGEPVIPITCYSGRCTQIIDKNILLVQQFFQGSAVALLHSVLLKTPVQCRNMFSQVKGLSVGK